MTKKNVLSHTSSTNTKPFFSWEGGIHPPNRNRTEILTSTLYRKHWVATFKVSNSYSPNY